MKEMMEFYPICILSAISIVIVAGIITKIASDIENKTKTTWATFISQLFNAQQ